MHPKTLVALTLGSVLALSALVAMAGQATIPKPGGHSKIKTDLLPMFEVVKSMGFTVTELPSSKYSFSRAEVAMMPAGFAGIKVPQKMVYLTYGFKKGGLVRMYETAAIPGRKAGKLIGAIRDSHVFHDSYGDPGYVTAELNQKGAIVVVASLKKELLQDALECIKHPSGPPAR